MACLQVYAYTMLKNENWPSKIIFVISGNFRYQEICPFEKMDIRMASLIITKNSAADPEIALYVLVRVFFQR